MNDAKPGLGTRIALLAMPTLLAVSIVSLPTGLALLVWGGLMASWQAVVAGAIIQFISGSWIWSLFRTGTATANSANLVDRLVAAVAERSPTN